MKHLDRWLCVNGKVPVHPHGHKINPHSPNEWMSYTDAKAAAELMNYGVGFAFVAGDGHWFLDIDKCLQEDGQWSDLAKSLCAAFQGACIEVSQSGKGLHIFGTGIVPEHSCKNKDFGIEFYHDGRFALINSDLDNGDYNLDCSANLKWLVDNYFPPGAGGDDGPWRSEPVPEWNGPTGDAVLLEKMLRSGGAKAAFGGKATFRDLYEANEAVLAANYPNQNEKDPYDRSSADFALANHLAFWTGGHHSRIMKFMTASALRRDKWTKHKKYLEDTIRNGVNSCQDVYAKLQGAEITEVVVNEEPGRSDYLTPVARIGSQYMSPQQQLEWFKDCVYIKQSHRILVPNGAMLKPEVFKATYAGYTFALDAENIKTTKNAFEAFIDNQAISFPKVDGTCFQPKLAPYEVVKDDGVIRVNSYVPVKVSRTKGDASKFLTHMQKLFPLEQDHSVIMAYMAAVVQYPGYKFQWCPIIQGAEGNGKTLIGRVLEAAVGQRYTHYPNAADLGGNGLKFTGWIANKLFIFIEEIYTSDRRELTEPMKVVITNDRIEIQPKGQDQYVGDNVANLIMCSNHKDCMKLSVDQRRYWMHFTPQQTVDDIIKDGMGGSYFTHLYDWLKYEGGYAIVTDFLMDYQIPDALNPATKCNRAPHSSSREESISLSLGVVEQHIMEAIDDERPGFKNGYISSKALKDLLVEIKKDGQISPQRRTGIMESLGYYRHPWLPSGRTNNPVAAEGAKITIFTNLSLSAAPRISAVDVKSEYEKAQEYSTPKLEAVK